MVASAERMASVYRNHYDVGSVVFGEAHDDRMEGWTGAALSRVVFGASHVGIPFRSNR